jgi:hypothetical protein
MANKHITMVVSTAATRLMVHKRISSWVNDVDWASTSPPLHKADEGTLSKTKEFVLSKAIVKKTEREIPPKTILRVGSGLWASTNP